MNTRQPRRRSTFLFNFAVPILLIVLAQTVPICLPLDVTPESAVNPIGTSHTVSATPQDAPEGEWAAFFFIISGPNEGQSSIFDCNTDNIEGCIIACEVNPGDCILLDCDPTDCTADGEETISWTYVSNGLPGQDVIVVCALDEEDVPNASFPAGVEGEIPEESLDEVLAGLREAGCSVVYKVWDTGITGNVPSDFPGRFTPTPTSTLTPTATTIPGLAPTATPTVDRPNVGGIFGGIIGADPAGVRNAATPTPVVAAAAAVRPPNTGDAGLAGD